VGGGAPRGPRPGDRWGSDDVAERGSPLCRMARLD
jgi:hypothetical protein